MKNEITREKALHYHEFPLPGKVEVYPSKAYDNQYDLSLAYSPGVSYPCAEIVNNPDDVYRYTGKGNLVAVISNGTAVLGMGNIGPLAGKPVMEGKALLFKVFAGIDCYDLEIDASDPDRFVDIVKALEPGFGGINLEDIKAPECFEIERRLKEECHIPVMHDDQHGTAIIASAALINALDIQGKKIDEVKVVVNGAGAAAVACARLWVALGVRRDNVVMCDSKGVITAGRAGLGDTKLEFATARGGLVTLADAMKGADLFLGLSVKGVVTADMVRSMADRPIVFALANPDPEISYQEAHAARPDLIFATGRSDYPNQINNVLGFPYIFRGALDTRATGINDEMKLAAAKAIARIARMPVDADVRKIYPDEAMEFGRSYILPKPFDHRILTEVAPAVARAAAESGVARRPIADLEAYKVHLDERRSHESQVIHCITSRKCTL